MTLNTCLSNQRDMNFIDQVRSQGQTPGTYRNHLGFDPDLSHAAFAILRTFEPILNVTRITRLAVMIVEPKRERGVVGCNAASNMIDLFRHSWIEDELNTVTEGIIEGQQFYPRSQDDNKKKAAKANDLIDLALISGAVRSMVPKATIKLPAGWKGQRAKENMHQSALDIILPQLDTLHLCRIKSDDTEEEPVRRKSKRGPKKVINALNPDAHGFIGIHAMDAICMALKSAGFKV